MKALIFILNSCLLLVFTDGAGIDLKVNDNLVVDNSQAVPNELLLQEVLPIVMSQLTELRQEVTLLKADRDKLMSKILTTERKVKLNEARREQLLQVYNTKKQDKVSEKIVEGPHEPSAITSMPHSCLDLEMNANSAPNSGFFVVSDSVAKMAKLVYCDFVKPPEEPGYETNLGYIDVKTIPTYFYLQSTSGTYYDGNLYFNVEQLNIGNAIRVSDGIFIAPVDGIYYFALAGKKDDDNNDSTLNIYVNSNYLGSAYCSTHASSNAASLHSTLALKKGDRVHTGKQGNGITDEPNKKTTHFTGWLLQETSLSFV